MKARPDTRMKAGMKAQDIIIAGAAAAFLLASGRTANHTEEINVDLPERYSVIWDRGLEPAWPSGNDDTPARVSGPVTGTLTLSRS